MKIKIKTHYKRAENQKYNGILSHLKLMSIEKCIIILKFSRPNSWKLILHYLNCSYRFQNIALFTMNPKCGMKWSCNNTVNSTVGQPDTTF